VQALRLQNARDETLDRNDNFITHANGTHGPIDHWHSRTVEYAEAVYDLVMSELRRAAHSCQIRNPQLSLHLQNFPAAQVSIRSAEYYWEFGVDSATRKVHDIKVPFAQILSDMRQTQYDVHNRSLVEHRNSISVSGKLGNQNISAKIYAKSSHVLRYEVTFEQRPMACLTRERRAARDQALVGGDRLTQELQLLESEAIFRSNGLWREFWNLARTTEHASQERLTQFLSRLSRGTNGSQVSASEILSILLERGSIVPFAPSDNPAEPVRRLRDLGLLTRISTTHGQSSRYRVASPYISVLDYIRAMPPEIRDCEVEQSQETHLAFEDHLPVRARPRSRSSLEM